MENDMPSSETPNGPLRAKAEDFPSLSNQFFLIAQERLLDRDFLSRICTMLTDFSGCDEVEIWIEDDGGKHVRCSKGRDETQVGSFQNMPWSLTNRRPESDTQELPASFEDLCHLVIRDELNREASCVTPFGSLFTGCSSDGINDRAFAPQEPGSWLTRLAEPFSSMSLIPIKTGDGCTGLLQLKSDRERFFTEQEVSFYEDVAVTLGLAFSHQHIQIELRERIKELTCLYRIAQFTSQPDLSFEEVIQKIVELLPGSWLYPEIASARIVLGESTYITEGFKECPDCQSADILKDGLKIGTVEVVYHEKRPSLDEGPFLTEERSLIDIVAREVANFYERRKAEEERSILQGQLRHADRLATIGQLAAGVAHELNEPLGNILGFAQLSKKGQDLNEQTVNDIDKIISASLHAREIIKKLMTFARQLPPKKIPVNLNTIVKDGIYFFEARCAKAGIELVRHLSRDLPEITADPGQLNQVLVNLVVNAIHAMPQGGTLTLETVSDKDQALLIVEDTGIGMNSDVLKQIFIPFFTTKDVDEGTGLGLPVVHGIVASHKGNIEVKSRPEKGTRFEIRLPIFPSVRD